MEKELVWKGWSLVHTLCPLQRWTEGQELKPSARAGSWNISADGQRANHRLALLSRIMAHVEGFRHII